MDVLTHDILIIGGGGAGLRAAIAVAEAEPRLSVAVVSKVYPGGAIPSPPRAAPPP